MVFDEKVLTALEVLTDAAENDFELYRICTLVRDLVAPPKVEVIDEKHQRFNGVTYHEEKDGHYARRVFIHRSVAIYYYGDIPADFDVRHDNRNKADNDISNLIPMSRSEHHSLHMAEKGAKIRAARKMKNHICECCGKTFQSLTSQSKYCSAKCGNSVNWERRKKCVPKKCEWCGKDFLAPKNTEQRFCSLSCLAHWREQQKPQKPNKICEWCGKPFSGAQGATRFCSKKCARAAYFSNTETRVCPVCGEQFTAVVNHPHIYCSNKCIKKAARERRKTKN